MRQSVHAASLLALLLPFAVTSVSAMEAERPNAEPQPSVAVAAPVDGLQAIRAQIKEQGSAPIILSFALPFRAEGTLSKAKRLAQREAIRTQQGLVLKALGLRVDSPGVKAFQFIPGMALWVDDAQLNTLTGLSQIAKIQPDAILEPLLNETVPHIGADETIASEIDGEGALIAVLDGGFLSTHQDFGSRVVEEGCFSTNLSTVQSTCAGGTIQEFGPGSAPPVTGIGNFIHHGTYIASMAGGQHGVAPKSELMLLQVESKFLDEAQCGVGQAPCLKGFNSDLIRGLEYVYFQVNAWGLDVDIVNLSVGGDGFSDLASCNNAFIPTWQAVENLRSKGVETVGSSGKDGNHTEINAPACLTNVLSVGSITLNDDVSSFSNSASFLNYLAPGEDVTAAGAGGGYVSASGTSASAAHVAGAYAALKSAHPGSTPQDIWFALSTSGVPVLDWRNSVVTPRVQLDAAVEHLRGDVRFHSAELGHSLTAGDFTNDGFDDVFVGHFRADVNGVSQSGMGVSFYSKASGGLVDDTIIAWPSELDVYPNPGMAMGYGVAAGDFDLDGRDDRVVGFPGGDAGGALSAGFVCIGVSEDDGSMTWGDCFHQGGGTQPEAGDNFGESLAVGDFDCDGLLDVAVGAPKEDWGSTQQAGVVMVFSGNGDGTIDFTNNPLLLKNNDFGDAMIAGDQFGSTLTSGDLNWDGCDDLVIGTPRNNTDGVSGTGLVTVAFGHVAGVGQMDHRNFKPSDFAIANDTWAYLGEALVVGDFNGDNRPDLAIGAPGVDVNGKVSAGAVFVVEAGKKGMADVIHTLSDLPGMAAAPHDRLGEVLDAGRIDPNDAYDELVIGVPNRDFNDNENVGMAHIIYGSAGGPKTDNMLTLIPSDVSALDNKQLRFASSLAIGHFTDKAGIAFGVPGLSTDGFEHSGAVCIYTHEHNEAPYCLNVD